MRASGKKIEHMIHGAGWSHPIFVKVEQQHRLVGGPGNHSRIKLRRQAARRRG